MDSAPAQGNVDVSVIVVIDDGCEITRRTVEELGDERVTVLVNPANVGAPASRNRGLELACVLNAYFAGIRNIPDIMAGRQSSSR